MNFKQWLLSEILSSQGKYNKNYLDSIKVGKLNQDSSQEDKMLAIQKNNDSEEICSYPFSPVRHTIIKSNFILDNGGFIDKDTEYIDKMYSSETNKGIVTSLNRMLSKVKDFDFHIFIGKFVKYIKYKDNATQQVCEKFTADYREKELENYLFNKMNIPQNHIIFIKQGTTGDILTPWMILHSMAHALTSYLTYVPNEIERFLIKLKNPPKTTDNYISDILTNPNLHSSYDILSLLFNFRSIRNTTIGGKMSRVQDPQEQAHELFVYYLINGLIIPIPNQENINKIASYIQESPENTRLHIENLFKKIESIFYKSLERIKGSIITD